MSGDGTSLKFCTWNKGMGPYIEQNKFKTSQNESWPRSCATSSTRDLLNKQATEALRNGNPRIHSLCLPTRLPNVDLVC